MSIYTETDFVALAEQKRELVTALNTDNGLTVTQHSALTGILHLIDAFQDSRPKADQFRLVSGAKSRKALLEAIIAGIDMRHAEFIESYEYFIIRGRMRRVISRKSPFMDTIDSVLREQFPTLWAEVQANVAWEDDDHYRFRNPDEN